MAVIEVELRPPNAPDVWKILCEGSQVSVLGPTKQSKSGLIGSGTWTGKGIGKRYSPDDLVTAKLWHKIEVALRERLADAPAPRPLVDSGVIVDLSSGQVVRELGEPKTAFEWKVTAIGSDVTVDALGKPGFARARWDGAQLVDHEVKAGFEGEINDYQWSVVEGAVARARGVVPRVRPAVQVPVATDDAPATRREQRATDRRSGWWAFLAMLVAIAATVLSIIFLPKDDQMSVAIMVALGVIALGITIYWIWGATTACPSCTSWFRRETTSVTETGTSTYSKQISKAVTDSSGKQIGTTYETATYERTSYLYHYRCKQCHHAWTGTGSSERRIS